MHRPIVIVVPAKGDSAADRTYFKVGGNTTVRADPPAFNPGKGYGSGAEEYAGSYEFSGIL